MTEEKLEKIKKLEESIGYGAKLHDSFLKRYEFAPEYDYGKGKWKNG